LSAALSDGVTGRLVTTRSGRGRDPVPRSERGRDIDMVSLCARSGRYKSRRRNKTGGDADPVTVNTLSVKSAGLEKKQFSKAQLEEF